MSDDNPCLSCGACCAFFRVIFHWIECIEKKIPEHTVEKISDRELCMKGTNKSRPHCICLSGEIGQKVHCLIYEERPYPCIRFKASLNGSNPSCDRARAYYGLKSLKNKSSENKKLKNKIKISNQPKKFSI